jgi:Fe-S-cluster containining protein
MISDKQMFAMGRVAQIQRGLDLRDAMLDTRVEGPCGSCRRPGACCTKFMLPLQQKDAPTLLHAMVIVASVNWKGGDGSENIGLPFYHDGETASGHMVWSCSELGPDGRCMIYDRRPKEPCAAYKPGDDILCVEFLTIQEIGTKGLERRGKPVFSKGGEHDDQM